MIVGSGYGYISVYPAFLMLVDFFYLMLKFITDVKVANAHVL